MEQWRQIILDGEKYQYEVSDLGNVRNAKTKKILKQRDNGHGYLFVDLWKNGDGKQMYIHRLVCLMFVENDDPEHKIQVNHKDECKSNNFVENLEWMTPKENTNYCTATKRQTKKRSKKVIGYSLTENKVIILQSCRQGNKFGFAQSAICNCCNGKLKHYKGYVWCYID